MCILNYLIIILRLIINIKDFPNCTAPKGIVKDIYNFCARSFMHVQIEIILRLIINIKDFRNFTLSKSMYVVLHTVE